MKATPESTWLRQLQHDMQDLLDHTATRPALDEDVRLKVKSVLYGLESPEVKAQYQGMDPYLVEQLLAGCLSAALALSETDPADSRSRLRLSLERARQSVRDIIEVSPVSADRDIKTVARWLVEHSEVSQQELADLLGTTPRTLQRWSSSSERTAPVGDQATRVRTLAGALNILRHIMTPAGAVRWLSLPHPDLDDRRPREVMGVPGEAPRVLRLATNMRASVAA